MGACDRTLSVLRALLPSDKMFNVLVYDPRFVVKGRICLEVGNGVFLCAFLKKELDGGRSLLSSNSCSSYIDNKRD